MSKVIKGHIVGCLLFVLPQEAKLTYCAVSPLPAKTLLLRGVSLMPFDYPSAKRGEAVLSVMIIQLHWAGL